MPEAKSVTINMRCASAVLSKIDRAADALGTNRSDFIRTASVQRALAILASDGPRVVSDGDYLAGRVVKPTQQG